MWIRKSDANASEMKLSPFAGLQLPILFAVVFAEDLTLAGRKHHAIMDALQLALPTNLLLDFYMSNP